MSTTKTLPLLHSLINHWRPLGAFFCHMKTIEQKNWTKSRQSGRRQPRERAIARQREKLLIPVWRESQYQKMRDNLTAVSRNRKSAHQPAKRGKGGKNKIRGLKGRTPTAEERRIANAFLAASLHWGYMHGVISNEVSLHHIVGRTAPGCRKSNCHFVDGTSMQLRLKCKSNRHRVGPCSCRWCGWRQERIPPCWTSQRWSYWLTPMRWQTSCTNKYIILMINDWQRQVTSVRITCPAADGSPSPFHGRHKLSTGRYLQLYC